MLQLRFWKFEQLSGTLELEPNRRGINFSVLKTKTPPEGGVFVEAFLLDSWWPGAESNHRHKDFQSSALPTELPGQGGAL
jgi:hypothetical protein